MFNLMVAVFMVLGCLVSVIAYQKWIVFCVYRFNNRMSFVMGFAPILILLTVVFWIILEDSGFCSAC